MADYKKPDHWALKARQEGYPARSVYKLKEIDEKFNLCRPVHNTKSSPGFRVLDLGAAPGSWSLYILRKMPRVILVSADLSPLSRECDGGLFDGGNVCFIQGDITDSAVRESIGAQGPYNLIISDAAPPTTGNRLIDTSRSLELAEEVTSYAESFLAAGGNMLVKLFQGQDTAGLLKRIKTLFRSAQSYKPIACRSDSFETYYVGKTKI